MILKVLTSLLFLYSTIFLSVNFYCNFFQPPKGLSNNKVCRIDEAILLFFETQNSANSLLASIITQCSALLILQQRKTAKEQVKMLSLMFDNP